VHACFKVFEVPSPNLSLVKFSRTSPPKDDFLSLTSLYIGRCLRSGRKHSITLKYYYVFVRLYCKKTLAEANNYAFSDLPSSSSRSPAGQRHKWHLSCFWRQRLRRDFLLLSRNVFWKLQTTRNFIPESFQTLQRRGHGLFKKLR